MIEKLSNLDEFNMKCSIPNKLVVIDFTATWCGPCQRIAPFFEELSNRDEYITKCHFYKVDVDECEDISEHCEISTMPTFQFYLNGKKVDELIGADTDELVQKLKQSYSTLIIKLQ